jgi:hypothetical protein
MSHTIPHVEPRETRLKRCSGPCRELLPITCFPRDRHNPDGRRNECSACRQERREQLAAGAPRRRPWERRRARTARAASFTKDAASNPKSS